MSRRIQIHRINYKSCCGLWDTTELHITVYSVSGKAELSHDPEVILMACADVLNRGNATGNMGWSVNGLKDERRIRHAATIIHDWADDGRSALRDKQTEVSRELIFDAGEVASRGEVIWRVTTPRREPTPWSPHNDLTACEVLRHVAEIIIKARA
tara:strand:- start:558 stop:1022 length:465 start_codon:yes stop_codon:yes gene_type:complete